MTGESAEQERQAALDGLELDAFEEAAYDDITRLASELFQAPVALISIVDGDRQWFKSRVGVQARESPRDVAFCAVAIENPDEVLIVEDATRDARFLANPLVTADPNIRFYVGAPLVLSSGHAIGTVCVLDVEPRTVAPEQVDMLRFLARQVIAKLEEKAAGRTLEA